MPIVTTVPNTDLTITSDNKGRWNMPEQRRHSFHHLHEISRYTMSFRSANVMQLSKQIDYRIANRSDVKALTSLPSFSAMVIIKGQHILFEQYAPDFGAEKVHSIQSISKTTTNLIIGKLVDDGLIDLSKTVDFYLPEVSSGYAKATVQQVLNMDVINEYTEDFSDPQSMYYDHEEAMGWRLPKNASQEATMQQFVAGIKSNDIVNHEGILNYKDANTDILGWIAERVSGKNLRAFFADIIDAAGIEGSFFMCTDRLGFPVIDGGGVMTARDLARYGSIFVRGGMGINGEIIGSENFIKQTITQKGVPYVAGDYSLRYSNQSDTNGRWLGHGGYGGQYMLADLQSGVVGVFFSVVENKDGMPDDDYYNNITNTLQSIGEMDF